MKIIDLLNKIANGEIEDKMKFRIYFTNNMHRDIYYDDEEQNQLNCLKNSSDDYPIYDDICLLDEVEIIEEEPRDIEVCGSWFTKSEYNNLFLEEEKKIPEKLEFGRSIENGEEILTVPSEKMIIIKINEIIDYLKSKGE